MRDYVHPLYLLLAHLGLGPPKSAYAMRLFSYSFMLHAGVVAAGNVLQAALDEICAFHNRDSTALSRTLDSLTEIATRLQSEPENPKYRQLRLLNKTFWERIGSVNGGISFMSSLGFDLLDQGGFQQLQHVQAVVIYIQRRRMWW